MTIKELIERAHGLAKEKGFWPEGQERPFPTLAMLIVSEISEAVEADRAGKFADRVAFDAEMNFVPPMALSEGDGYDFPTSFRTHIKDTVEDEIADTVIRLMDLAGGMGIDLEWHIENKLLFNSTREARHGKKY